MSGDSIDRQVQVLKAVAHPSRLQIAQALMSGGQCVTDLMKLVGGDLSTVSKHLTLMRKAGWLSCEKKGQQVYYELACDCLTPFLRCVDSIGSSDSTCEQSCDCD